MKGLLFLNGQPPSDKTLQNLDFCGSFVVCADGAYDYLSKYALPDLLVGDLDSCQNRTIKAKKIERLLVEKDFTDGHIAMLRLLENSPETIEIYGALGGAPDHALANYSLLLLAQEKGITAEIVSENHRIYLSSGSFSAPASTGKRVSLVPFFDEVHILETKGLKYQIADEVLDKRHIKGISNVATSDRIGIEIIKGAALVFVEK